MGEVNKYRFYELVKGKKIIFKRWLKGSYFIPKEALPNEESMRGITHYLADKTTAVDCQKDIQYMRSGFEDWAFVHNYDKPKYFDIFWS